MDPTKLQPRTPRHGSKGFTLVELIVVIVLLGTLSVLVMPRFLDMTLFKQRGFHDQTVSALRYAQKLAVASGCDVQVTLGGGGYALLQRAACDTSSAFTLPVHHPAGSGSFTATAPSGVSVSAASIIFTPLGRAVDGARVPSNFVGLDVGGHLFHVIGETGYVDTP
jgi:MSHA pilin protein MshC